MSSTGPACDIASLHTFIQENYARIKQQPGDIGTCKKVISLEAAIPDDARFKDLALATMHGNTSKDEELIRLEYQYLNYLKKHEYPVVTLHGEVFEVERIDGKIRYGMLMDYIPKAAFIEAKTPASLQIFILAGLLGIPTRAQEAWLAINKTKLLAQIKRDLSSPETADALKIRAKLLKAQLGAFIEKLKTDDLAIADLQMLITSEGKFTIIDPLDIVKKSNATSLFMLGKEADRSFIQFLRMTDLWLNSAMALCNKIQLDSSVSFLDQGFLTYIPSHTAERLLDKRLKPDSTLTTSELSLPIETNNTLPIHLK